MENLGLIKRFTRNINDTKLENLILLRHCRGWILIYHSRGVFMHKSDNEISKSFLIYQIYDIQTGDLLRGLIRTLIAP